MKLKYYMRGLGIGIIFSIVVMSLTSANGKEKMTDSEIIHAAKALGMVEAVSSVDLSGLKLTPKPEETATLEPTHTITPDPVTSAPDPTISAQPSKTPDPTNTPEPTATPDPTNTKEPTAMPEPTNIPEATATPEPIPIPTTTPEATTTPEPTVAPPVVEPTKIPEAGSGDEVSTDKITLSIVKGMYSKAVSEEAYRVGLVDDAKLFDDYLIANGFASSIRIGVYEFEPGVTYYQIADQITRRTQ